MKVKRRTGGVSFDAILLACIKLITTALGLAITRLLSEYLSVYDYGTYSQVLLVTSTVASLTILGMMDGMNYFYCGESEVDKREAYVSTIFALQCTVGTVAGGLVLLLSAPLCAYFDNPGVGPLLIFAAVLPLLQNLLGVLQILIVSTGKAKMLAIRNLIISIFRLIAVFIVVLAIRNIVVILISSVVLDIGQIAFFWLILRKNNCYIRLSKADIHLVGRILRYCAPMAIFTMINSLNRDMDKYLISMVTDTETLALYTNASKQLPFDIIMASFCTVLIPYITKYISENRKEKAADLYKLFLEIAYISTGILCGAALSVAPQLMKLLYSNKYGDGLAIFCIYIFIDLFRFTNITLVLSAAGRTRRLMVLGTGSLLLNAVLNMIFYRAMGIRGPAIATLIVTLATGILILHFSAQVLGMHLLYLFNLKYLLIFTVESSALTIAMTLLQNLLAQLDVHYFAIIVFVAGLYGVVMLMVNGKRLISALKRVNSVEHDEM